MRTLLVLGLVGLAGGAAAQERVVVRGPGVSYPEPSAAPDGRWGSQVDGRWWGGVNAPGGYAAYRRPVRGHVLPAYWNASRFHVDDWRAYDLPEPPAGYRWVRYYDDAVLIDARGSVYDTEFGVAWDRGGRYAAAEYPRASYDPRAYQRRDDGLGGAAVGAGAGGALGAAVAGRGDRLGGALIGGGLGAATGYAIDRAEDRRAPPPPPLPGYGAGYPAPDAYGAAYPPPPPLAYGGGYVTPGVQTLTVPAGGAQTVFVGPGVTMVTVTTQPAVTTTTTEYYDEAVTYTRPARQVVRPRRSKLKRR